MTGFSDQIRIFDQARSQGEADGQFLKRQNPADETGRHLYELARSGYNGLVRQILADLAQHRRPQLTAEFQASMTAAAQHGQALAEYAATRRRAIAQPGTKMVELAAALPFLPDILAQLRETVFGIWDRYDQAQTERRHDMRDMLEGEMWRAWEQL